MALRRLLENKGYNFAEELDLGLLDKQFRKPFPLAETEAAPKKKKRRQADPFGEHDEDQNDDDMDAGLVATSRALKTDAEREREEQLREERAREARQWDNEFSIRRNVDRGSNALLRDQFVVATKKEYTAIQDTTQRYYAHLDQVGIIDSKYNQIRATAFKRVILAKKLKMDEIKGRSVQEVVNKIVKDTKQKAVDRDDHKDSGDGLEDVLRAEEQIRRLVGDGDFEDLGQPDKGYTKCERLVFELKELTRASDGSDIGRMQSSAAEKRLAGVDQRQKAFDHMMQELRLLDTESKSVQERRSLQIELRIAAFERLDEKLRNRADDQLQSRSSAPWNKPPAQGSATTLRERQRHALNSHLAHLNIPRPSESRGLALDSARRGALSARGSSPLVSSPVPRRPESSMAGGHMAATDTATPADKITRTRSRSNILSTNGKSKGGGEVEVEKSDKRDKGATKNTAHQEKDVQIIPGAPTPKEMLQVDDQFAKKRREIRMHAKNRVEECSTKRQELDNDIKAVTSKVVALRKDGGDGWSTDVPSSPHAEKESVAVEKHGQQVHSIQSASAHAKEGGEASGSARRAAQKETTVGSSDKPPLGHIRVAPELRAPVFCPIAISSSDPLLSYTGSETRVPEPASPPKGVGSPVLSPKEKKEDELGSVGGAGKRRTKYLSLYTSDGKELGNDLLPSLVAETRAAKGKALVVAEKGSTLNPSFASFEAPGKVVLQAAEPRITPRIAKVKTELQLRPPHETFYHPDSAALRRGTPDLEAALGSQVGKSLSSKKQPNLAGEASLLALLQGGREDDGIELGPAPSVGGRKKKPTKKRASSLVKGEPPSEDALIGLAKDMVAEESLSLGPQSAPVEIPPEDKKVMKTRARDKGPAPLDDQLAQRLEKVWDALEMPMLEKLGMVVKYSDLEHVSHLEESLEAWELAAAAVLAREKALQELVRIKNDPSKASVVPVAESSIQVLSDQCAKPIEQLLLLHGDVVTLRGMPYAEDLTAPLAQVVDRVQTGGRLRPRLSQAR